MNLKITSSLLIITLILSGCVSKGTRYRKGGLELRQGYYYPVIKYNKDLLGGEKSTVYVETNTEVNNKPYARFPINYESAEDGQYFIYNPTGEAATYRAEFFNEPFGNFIVNFLTFSFENIKVDDIPPVLSKTSYQTLIDKNTINNKTSTFSIKSNQTNIDQFLGDFPQYKHIIDSANEPSLSTDLDASSLGFIGWGGKTFFSLSRNHRFFETGARIYSSYTWGKSTLNICDPYLVYGEKLEVDALYSNIVDYRKGVCHNRTKLSEHNLTRLDAIGEFHFGVYGYVGETWGFDIFNISLGGFGGFLDPFLNWIPFIDYNVHGLDLTVRNVYLNLVSIKYKGE